MKNYALTEEDSVYFITEFNITEDKIILYYGDGHTERREKTKEEFDRIISILENQIKHSDKAKEKSYSNIRQFVKLGFHLISFCILLGATLSYYGYSGIAWFLIAGISSIPICSFIHSERQIIKDISKHQTFLENQSSLVENIKTKHSVLMNTTEKTQTIIKNELQNPTEFLEDQPINFKNIGDIPESDLNLILENIEELNTLGYVSPEREDKVLRFKPHKKH